MVIVLILTYMEIWFAADQNLETIKKQNRLYRARNSQIVVSCPGDK